MVKNLMGRQTLGRVYIIINEEQAMQVLKTLSRSIHSSKLLVIFIDLHGVSAQTAINLIKTQALSGIVAVVLTGAPATVNKILSQVEFNIIPTLDEVIVSDGSQIIERRRVKTLTLGVLYYNGKVKYYSSINDKLISDVNEGCMAVLKDLKNMEHNVMNNIRAINQIIRTKLIKITTAQADFTYEKYPYGKLNIRDAVGDLNDVNPDYWLRYYQFRSQILPGVLVYGTEYRNAGILSEIDVDYYSPQGGI